MGGGGQKQHKSATYYSMQLKQKEKFFNLKWIYLKTRKTTDIGPNRKRSLTQNKNINCNKVERNNEHKGRN